MIDDELYFPEPLKRLPIWVLWRLEEREGRKTKVPYQVNGYRASSTNASQWAIFDAAMTAWAKKPIFYQGIGIVISQANRLIFIDIDHCIRQDGSLDDRANDILELFRDDNGNIRTFVEFSQSGTGLHVITIGEIPRSFKNSRTNVEMYDRARFVAMTGKALAPCDPSECPDGLRYVFERYKTASRESAPMTHPVDPSTRHDDDWIIRHASARDGSKFTALFSGDFSGFNSRSEADAALCCLLAFWTNKDAAAMDRIFRRSGMYRAKWERPSYRDKTINSAIAFVNDTLSDFTRRSDRERGMASLAELSSFGK